MAGLEGLLRGRRVGDRYRIEEVIGRGGMGAVYRAVDERLGRPVAVKVITASGGGDPALRDRLRARFHHEARAAAALPHHPNVVPVYDFGTDPTLGLDYLVMELLRGEDLATRLANQGPPPVGTGIWILREAARGVAVGHRSRLVHRDVKPGNIFLAAVHGEEAEVRVLDFGIAKLATEEDTETSGLTQEGRTPLSPGYAAPEQLRGLTQLTPAADVFSLGAVGFQLLTGERPFTEADRSRMIQGEAVPLPSARALRPEVPEAVDAVLHRALSFDPEQRFPDARAFGSALDEAGGGRSTQAPADPYLVVPAAVPHPEPSPAPGGPAGERTEFMDDRTLLAPSSSPAPPGGLPPARPIERPAALPPPREPERAAGLPLLVWALVVLVLAGAGGLIWLWLDDTPDLRTQLPAPPPELEVVVPEPLDDEPVETQPELVALLDDQRGRAYYRQGQYDSALFHFRRATEISPDNTDFRNNYAQTLLRLGMVEEAERELVRVIRMNPTQERAYVNLADARLALGDTLGAVEALEGFVAVTTRPADQARVERRIEALRAAMARPDPAPTVPPIDTVPRIGPPSPREPPRTDTLPREAPPAPALIQPQPPPPEEGPWSTGSG
jgi:eukaryotic-like serine/threonine-protein kinase